MKQFYIELDGGKDSTYMVDIQCVCIDGGYIPVDKLDVGVVLKAGQKVTLIKEVPLLAFNELATQIGADRPVEVTKNVWMNFLAIFLDNGGKILCDLMTEFDIEGERHPITAKRLRQKDVLKNGLIITNIIHESGPSIGWGAWNNGYDLVRRSVYLADEIAEAMIKYRQRCGEFSGAMGMEIELFQSPECIVGATRVIRGHSVFVTRLTTGQYEWIVCKPDNGVLKGEYVRGSSSKEEVEKKILELVS